jgi:hypothetical protein
VEPADLALGLPSSSELELRGALAGRQDHWRRCSRMGETAVDVAERRVYAILKEN